MPIVSLDDTKIDRIAALVEAETPLEDWPAEWFQVDDNIRVSGLLLKDDLSTGIGLSTMLALDAADTLSEIIQSGLRAGEVRDSVPA